MSTIGGVGSGYASIFKCWNATRPPRITATKSPTIRNRRLTARETRRSIRCESLGARSRPIYEQAAPGYDFLSGLQIGAHFDKVTVGQTGPDLAELERPVIVGDPQPHALALIDQGLFGHADRRMVCARKDSHIG